MSEAADAHVEASPDPPAGGSDGNWGVMFKLLAALNPVILLIVGYVLHHNIDEAKVQIDQTKLQIEENSAKLADLKIAAEASSIVVHDRVDKVKVISEFTDNLTSTDDRRRRIAIEAIFIALPDEAARWSRPWSSRASKLIVRSPNRMWRRPRMRWISRGPGWSRTCSLT